MFPSNLRINSDRFHNNFELLSQIGATVDGGNHRPTFSKAHQQARKWFMKKAKSADLEIKIDDAGNHSAILYCGPANAPLLLLGSHLDTVPKGGKFDGALGVLAGLEVIQVVQESGLKLPFHLEVIDFTDEEGTLVGLLGSSAIAGKLEPQDLLDPRGGRQSMLDGLTEAGLNEKDLMKAKRDPNSLAGYLELHIEQGSRLQDSKTEIGIVTSIVGIRSYKIAFIGQANHAGTTSMEGRLDAGQGASAFTLAVRKLVLQEFKECVANVGNMHFDPGVFNIIPQCVNVFLEIRAPTVNLLDQMAFALIDLAKEQVANFNLELEIESLGYHPPAKMNDIIQDVFQKAANSLGLSTIRLSSGAGHDAQSMADICPSGMIFVPSINGVSHSPKEFTPWQDCLNGANTLLLTVLELGANRMLDHKDSYN